MGRPFVEFVDEERCSAKYVCERCGVDVAAKEQMVWEGYMRAQKPAYLFCGTTNIDFYGERRREKLTTGCYTLLDVRCRWCYTVLGWHYLEAENADQKYKEGGTLIEQGKLVRENFPTNSINKDEARFTISQSQLRSDRQRNITVSNPALEWATVIEGMDDRC